MGGESYGRGHTVKVVRKGSPPRLHLLAGSRRKDAKDGKDVCEVEAPYNGSISAEKEGVERGDGPRMGSAPKALDSYPQVGWVLEANWRKKRRGLQGDGVSSE
jgi:hypothetical protein